MIVYNMKELYYMLLSAVKDGDRDNNIINPAISIKGKFQGNLNNMPEEEYISLCSNIKEFDDIWNHKYSGKAGDIFLKAIEDLELDDDDVEDIAATLACAYERANEKTFDHGADNDKNLDGIRGDSADILCSPAKIYEYLERNIYGQEEAKKAAAMLLWNHVNGRRQNILFAGPTGCGKTEIFRQLSKIYPNIVIHNATALTGTGWKGNMKVRNLFDCADQKQMEHLIIVLDETDKMFEDADDKHYSHIIQNELLKLMEGDMVHFEGNPNGNEPTLDINTSNVSFVFLGSFDTMVRAKDLAVNNARAIGFGSESQSETFDGYNSTFTADDLIRYANVRSEVAGRIGTIVQLREMTESDFYAILNDRSISPLYKIEKYYGVKLKMSAKAKHKLARDAAENGLGVRYIRSQIQKKLDDKIFDDCGRDEYVIS